jgi:hypothetical protein
MEIAMISGGDHTIMYRWQSARTDGRGMAQQSLSGSSYHDKEC